MRLQNLPDSHTVAAYLEVYKRCVLWRRRLAWVGWRHRPLAPRVRRLTRIPPRRLLRQGDLQECVDVLGARPRRAGSLRARAARQPQTVGRGLAACHAAPPPRAAAHHAPHGTRGRTEGLNRAGVHDAAGRVRHKEFLAACSAQRAVSEAFQFVRIVSPPDVRVFNLLLSLCANMGDADAAFRAFRELAATGLRPDCLAFTTLIAACAKAGEVERAFEVYGDMTRARVAPSTVTFGALMDALSRDIGRAALTGDKSRVRARLAQCDALQKEHRAAGVPADAVMYNSLVSACGRAAAVDRHALGAAFAARREMQELGLPLCAYTYSALMDACTRAGDPARSLLVWDEFAASGLERTPEVVGAAAHACAALGNLERAMSIYYDSLAAGLRPDGVLFAILMVRQRSACAVARASRC